MTHQIVMAVLVDGDRVLLCHRHPDREWYPNVWDLPGGHVEPGESPADALRRELREELGIDTDPEDEPLLGTHFGDYLPAPSAAAAATEVASRDSRRRNSGIDGSS